MVTIEELSVVIPILVGVVVPVLMFYMVRHQGTMDKTVGRSSMATFNIGVMKDEVKELKDSIAENRLHFDQRVDALVQSLEKRDENHRLEFRRVWERVDCHSSSMKLVEYRLDMLETRGNGISGGAGGGRTPI